MAKKRYKMIEHEGDLADVFNDAKIYLEGLREEMDSYFEALPEGLQSSIQGEMAEQAADDLGTACTAIEDVDLDDPHGEGVTITYQEMQPYGKKVAPRWMRAATIHQQLSAVKQAVEDIGDSYNLTEDSAEWSEVAENLNEAIDHLDGIGFPGMYGR